MTCCATGYTSQNDLEESALNQIPGVKWPKDGMHLKDDLNPETVRQFIRDRVLIANVLGGRHFVVVSGLMACHECLTMSIFFAGGGTFGR